MTPEFRSRRWMGCSVSRAEVSQARTSVGIAVAIAIAVTLSVAVPSVSFGQADGPSAGAGTPAVDRETIEDSADAEDTEATDGEPGTVESDQARVEIVDLWFPRRVAESGLRPYGAWIPVYVELKSRSGLEEEAVVELLTESQFGEDERSKDRYSVRRTVTVPPGTARRVWLNARCAPKERQRVQLTISTNGARPEDERVVAFDRTLGFADSHDPSLEGSESTVAILFVGGGGDRLLPDAAWFRRSQFSSESMLVADSCPPDRLPTTPTGYHPFDLVVLRNLRDTRLEPVQVEALRRWVHLGGTVVLAPTETGAEILRGELAQALLGENFSDPGSVVERTPGPVVGIDRRRTRTAIGLADGIKFVVGVEEYDRPAGPWPKLVHADPIGGEVVRELIAFPRRIAEDLEFDPEKVDSVRADDPEAAVRLYSEVRRGAGVVGALCFDGSTFATPERTPWMRSVWEWILRGDGSAVGRVFPFQRNAAAVVQGGLVRRLQDSSRDVGFPYIVLLVVVYLVLVGPGLYFLLKRMGRLPWLIWVEPLVVFVYLGLMIVGGYVSKGVITKARQWTLISHRIGDEYAVRQSYLAVFAGAESQYDIGIVGSSTVKPIYGNDEAVPPIIEMTSDETGRQDVSNVELDQWAEAFVVDFDVLASSPEGVVVEVAAADGGTSGGGADTRARDADALPENALPTLRATVTNHLDYAVKTGIFEDSVRGQFFLPAVGPGESLEAELEPLTEETADRVPPEWRSFAAEAGQSGYGYGAGARIIAVIDRTDADFAPEWNGNLRERVELYAQFRR